ncbi:hypothetical protein A5710_20865 [Mycolicibacter sinensis]|uniref:Uncharacterized protein n=1 Tax=Mycolicibacter sinensis (strain JDM601) TaxID=875328 RepID=A0A1A2XXH4_MYCSD|nr:hypothetical protein A5710_20865 [Mycolicibacter sinensis]
MVSFRARNRSPGLGDPGRPLFFLTLYLHAFLRHSLLFMVRRASLSGAAQAARLWYVDLASGGGLNPGDWQPADA